MPSSRYRLVLVSATRLVPTYDNLAGPLHHADILNAESEHFDSFRRLY